MMEMVEMVKEREAVVAAMALYVMVMWVIA